MKEKNRYTIVEYKGKLIKTLDTLLEYDELIKKLKKLNDKESNEEYYGNVSYTTLPSGRLNVTIHMYKKLSKKTTIKEIDKLTSKYSKSEYIYENKDSLLDEDNMFPDINIAYFQTSKDDNLKLSLKYIPIIFKDDVKYLDYDYFFNFVDERINENDLVFFSNFANRFSTYKTKLVSLLTEKLFMEVNEVEFGIKRIDILRESTIKLYEALVYERDKNGNKVFDGQDYVKSYRKMRDISLFIKSYENKDNKKIIPFKYNEEKDNKEIMKRLREVGIIEREEKEKDFMLEEEMLDDWDKSL